MGGTWIVIHSNKRGNKKTHASFETINSSKGSDSSTDQSNKDQPVSMTATTTTNTRRSQGLVRVSSKKVSAVVASIKRRADTASKNVPSKERDVPSIRSPMIRNSETQDDITEMPSPPVVHTIVLRREAAGVEHMVDEPHSLSQVAIHSNVESTRDDVSSVSEPLTGNGSEMDKSTKTKMILQHYFRSLAKSGTIRSLDEEYALVTSKISFIFKYRKFMFEEKDTSSKGTIANIMYKQMGIHPYYQPVWWCQMKNLIRKKIDERRSNCGNAIKRYIICKFKFGC